MRLNGLDFPDCVWEHEGVSLPNKASPLGCAVGLIGLLIMGISAFFWRAFYLTYHWEDQDRAAQVRESIALWGSTSAILAIRLFVVAWRMAKSADCTSAWDPDKPKARF